MLPKFYNYHAEGPTDSGYEARQDFFLSWTLRCAAAEALAGPNGIVQEYARRMMYYLIHGVFNDGTYTCAQPVPSEFKVTRVETRRQEAYIDLIAEVDTVEQGISKHYLLSIENKWYTTIRHDQLAKYSSHVQKRYQDRQIVSLVITCDNCRKYSQQERTQCLTNGYKLLSVDDMNDYAGIEGQATGNDLFDAYWLK